VSRLTGKQPDRKRSLSNPHTTISKELAMGTMFATRFAMKKLRGHMHTVKAPKSLVDRAYAIVAAQSYFRGACYPIQIENSEGVLVITGSVPSFYLK
jgi:hypothetical protein